MILLTPIDSLHDQGTRGGWKAGHAMSKRLDEIAKPGAGNARSSRGYSAPVQLR